MWIHSLDVEGDALLIFGRDEADVWHFERFSLPGLEPTLELPSATVPPRDLVAFAAATDGTTEVALVHVPASLTAWDTRTGARLGDPVTVPDSFPGMTWARPGHPGQAVVATDGHLELWDVPAGRRLSSTALTVQDYASVAVGPDTLVAHTRDGNLEVRRLPDWEPAGAPIFAPDINDLLDFDPEGRLLATDGSLGGDGAIVVWDLEQRAEVGRIRPTTGSPTVVGGSLSILGGSGRLPQVLSMRAQDWQAQLCGLFPGEPSAGATALFPAGVDRSSPCR